MSKSREIITASTICFSLLSVVGVSRAEAKSPEAKPNVFTNRIDKLANRIITLTNKAPKTNRFIDKLDHTYGFIVHSDLTNFFSVSINSDNSSINPNSIKHIYSYGVGKDFSYDLDLSIDHAGLWSLTCGDNKNSVSEKNQDKATLQFNKPFVGVSAETVLSDSINELNDLTNVFEHYLNTKNLDQIGDICEY